MNYFIKIGISAILITAISELSKRSTVMGAALASLPLISILSMLWLYYDTGDLESVVELSRGIFFLILPSLTLFVSFPYLTKYYSFYPAFGIALLLTLTSYAGLFFISWAFGILG